MTAIAEYFYNYVFSVVNAVLSEYNVSCETIGFIFWGVLSCMAFAFVFALVLIGFYRFCKILGGK